MPAGTQADDAPAALRGLRTVGAIALVMLIALVAFLPWLVPIDDAAWRAVLLQRGCSSDVAVDRVVELATRLLFVLVVVVTVLHARQHGLRSVWAWIATFGLGLFAGKAMKHLLTRDRPSSLPDLLSGYSFPSAHAMNGVVALLAVLAFTQGFRRRRLWRVAGATLVIAMTAGRLLLGRHWICDVFGGVLMALAVGGLLVPIVGRRPLMSPAIVGGILIALFGLDHWAADRGLRLPAPLVSRAMALVDVDLGSDVQSRLSGDWREAADEPPGGSLVWLDGAGSVPVDVPARLVDGAAGEPATALRLAFAGRPATPLDRCTTVSIGLNGRSLAQFVPFSGWREYRVPIGSGLLRAGRNDLAIDVRTGDGPWRFAVAYVRLAADSRAE